MHALFVTCADSATVDATSNRLSIFNIVEDIGAAAFPIVIPSSTLVVTLQRKKTEPKSVTLQISGAMGKKELFNLPFDVTFHNHLRARAVANFQGMPIPGPGVLIVSVRYKKKLLGAWPIRVRSIGPMQISPQTSQTPVRKGVARVSVARTKRAARRRR